MKNIFIALFLFCSIASYSQGKFDVNGDLAPTGNYAIVKAKNLRGGYYGSVYDSVQRNLLPMLRRDSNMLVYTRVDSTLWILKGGLANDSWQVFNVGGNVYVPYTGANNPVNLGSQSLTANALFANYIAMGAGNSSFGGTTYFTGASTFLSPSGYGSNINGSLTNLHFTSKRYVDSVLASWSPLPTQAGNAGKYLQTNGTVANWKAPNFSDSVDFTGAGSGSLLRIKPGSFPYLYEFAPLTSGIISLSVNAPLLTTGSSTPTLSIDTTTAVTGVATKGYVNRSIVSTATPYRWVEQFDDDPTLSYPVTSLSTTFVLTNTPTDTVSVFKNGARQKQFQDYNINGATIIFVTAPLKKDIIQAVYGFTSAQPTPTRYNVANRDNTVGYGNSIVYGSVGYRGITDPVQQLRNMGSTVTDTMTNAGNPGQSTQVLNYNRASQLYGFINPGYKSNTVVIYEFINDIRQNSLSSVQAYDNMVTLCTNIKTERPYVKIALYNVAPTIYVADSVRANLNSRLAASHAFVDTLIDCTTSPAFNTNTAYLNPTYYQKDQVHLYTDGNNELAKSAYPYIKGLQRKAAGNAALVRPSSTGDYYMNIGGVMNFDTSITVKGLGTDRKANIDFYTNYNVGGTLDSLGQWKFGLRGNIPSTIKRYVYMHVNGYVQNARYNQELVGLRVEPAFGWSGSRNDDSVHIAQFVDRFGTYVLDIPYFQNATTGKYHVKFNGVNLFADNLNLTNLSTGTAAFDLKIDASGNVIKATVAGGGAWGSITGTLSNQTDLQSALNNLQSGINANTTAINTLSPANADTTVTSTYTLTTRDLGRTVTATSASPFTIVIPTGILTTSSSLYDIKIRQGGTGQIAVLAGSGMTIESENSLTRLYTKNSGACLHYINSSTVWLFGSLSQ